MGGEFEFPETIIHHIQYFLTGREAAATAVLSKSWNSAWLTRPAIDLDERDYYRKSYRTIPFPKLVRKTLQRYEESKIQIESFRLCYTALYTVYDGTDLAADNLLRRALKIGATPLDLHFRCGFRYFFVFPNDVFAAENLARLSVEGCIIDLGPDPNVIRCSKLESLTLGEIGVKPNNPNPICTIISRCPLIKNLSLSQIYEQKQKHYISEALGLSGFPNLHNIRCLVLSRLGLDLTFLADLSSKFPSLKDLTLEYTSVFPKKIIRVSSRSLEVLRLSAEFSTMRIEFDVPSIRKFTFEGPLIESLSFKPISREWEESHLSVICLDLSTSWFVGLNKLVTHLISQSKVHLSCCVDEGICFGERLDYKVEGLQGLPRPRVENLIMDTQCLPALSYSDLFDGLFRVCRPKFVTQYLIPAESSDDWETNNCYLCKTLVQQINEKCSCGMHSLDDLKEVNAQIFDEVAAEWLDIPLTSLLDASASPKEKQKVRFELEWRA